MKDQTQPMAVKNELLIPNNEMRRLIIIASIFGSLSGAVTVLLIVGGLNHA